MRWSEDRARESGADRIGQTVPDSLTDVISMLTANGYTPRRTSWILCMDHEERPADPEPPDGIRLRPYLPADEVEALTMFEEAFSEWEDRLPSSLPTWRTMVTNREGFQNDDLILAVDGEMIVGGAFMIDADEIWVDKFATHRDYRHRGIARGLLQAAFQRSFDRGYHKTRLSTDSNTGALSFYERIGMVVERSFTHYALDLK
jgi:ribosomal protein S18 acetylase RimI-like enzyme